MGSSHGCQGLWLGGELGKLGSCFLDVNFWGLGGGVNVFFPQNFGSKLFPFIREVNSKYIYIYISSLISSSQLAFPGEYDDVGFLEAIL